MFKITNVEDVRKFISSNKLALIGFINSSKSEDKNFIKVLNYLEKRIGNVISFALCDLKDNVDISSTHSITKTPLIKLYYNGKSIFEQEGSFDNFETDIYVLRISIKDVLRTIGIWLRF